MSNCQCAKYTPPELEAMGLTPTVDEDGNIFCVHDDDLLNSQ